MKIKTFAIIGKPNVGKSTFFNSLVGSREAVTANEAGTTRDRKSGICHWQGKEINVIDTGGFLFKKNNQDSFRKDISIQIDNALKSANEIFFLVDAKEAATNEDLEIAKRLRSIDKNIYLIANKCESTRDEQNAEKYVKLGLGKVYTLSAISGRGVGDFLDQIFEPVSKKIYRPTNRVKVAVVGRPNVGKSSLINKILNEERIIISDQPGTTRDSIDVNFNYEKKEIVFTDTAGIRKQGKIKLGAERFGVERARVSIAKSDKVILMVDAAEGLTRGDAHIAQFTLAKSKPLLIAFNKIDLVSDDSIQNLYRFPFLQKNPALFISVKTGKNIKDLLDWIIEKPVAVASENHQTDRRLQKRGR